MFRYEPLTQKFEVFTAYGFANPHGHVFDRWGTDIIIDGTNAIPYYGPSFTGKTYFPHKHGKAPTVYKQRTRPCSAAELLSSKHFPESMQGNLLVLNVIGFQGVLQYKLEEKDAGLVGTEVEPIVSSDDPNFRPSDIEMGPDGAIWFTDWHNPIIGHMQHNLRDPNRDKKHGRVYRVTYEGARADEVAEGGRPRRGGARPAEEFRRPPALTAQDRVEQPQGRRGHPGRFEVGRRADKSGENYEHQMAEARCGFTSGSTRPTPSC